MGSNGICACKDKEVEEETPLVSFSINNYIIYKSRQKIKILVLKKF